MTDIGTIAGRTIGRAALAGAMLLAACAAAGAEPGRDGLATGTVLAQADTGRAPLQVRARTRAPVVDVTRGFEYETAYGAFVLAPKMDTVADAPGVPRAEGLGVSASWRKRWHLDGRRFDLRLAQDNRMPLDDPRDLDHALRATAGVGSLFTLPSTGLEADVALAYQVIDLNAAVAGDASTRITLRDPIPRPTGADWRTRTDLGLVRRGAPEDGQARGLGRFALGVDVPGGADGLGVSLHERLDLGLAGSGERSLSTGLDLSFAGHSLGLRHRVRLDRRAPDDPTRAGLTYGWDGGLVDLSFGADYTEATSDGPADVFAGFAVTIGADAPGAGSVLGGLR